MKLRAWGGGGGTKEQTQTLSINSFVADLRQL